MRYIVANWKMNGLEEDWLNWADFSIKAAEAFDSFPSHSEKGKVIICPPAPAFSILNQKLKNVENVFLGAQSISAFPFGAHTGEIAGKQAERLGNAYTLVGHSEYRERHTKKTSYKSQIAQAHENSLTPILCIGETAEERKNGKTNMRLKAQLNEALENIQKPEDILIAYEPVWGIGGAQALKQPEAEDVEEAFTFIRSYLKQALPQHAENTPLLYGGSVNAENVCNFMQHLNINGVLVGSASLKSESFQGIVSAVSQMG